MSVITLNTLPGSNGVVIARLLRAFGGSSGPGGIVRIEARIIGHRQNFAVIGIQRHDRTGLGAARFDRLVQFLFRVVLQVGIDASA